MWPIDSLEKDQLTLVIVIGIPIFLIGCVISVVVIYKSYSRRFRKRLTDLEKEFREERQFHLTQVEFLRKECVSVKQRISSYYLKYFTALSEIVYRGEMRLEDRREYRAIMTEVSAKIDEVSEEMEEIDFIEAQQNRTFITALSNLCSYQNEKWITVTLLSDSTDSEIKFNPEWQGAFLRVLCSMMKITLGHRRTFEVEVHVTQTDNEITLSYIDKGIKDHYRIFASPLHTAVGLFPSQDEIQFIPDGVVFHIPLHVGVHLLSSKITEVKI